MAEDTSPTTTRRCTDIIFDSLPTSTPCTSTDIAPTAHSDQPICCGSQPNFSCVYSAQVPCRMNCASDANVTTPSSAPVLLSCARCISEPIGLARAQLNGWRRSGGSDSGSTKNPYSQLHTASAPAQ